MIKVLVCGWRRYNLRTLVFSTLDALLDEHGRPGFVVVHGDCRSGADDLARRWALDRRVQQERYPADWYNLGKRAGPIRNQRMLNDGKPDLVVAFPGGPGTMDMVRRAERAGVPVRRIGW